MSLFDAHCHIQDSRLAADLAGVLARARDAGVERMLCCGTSEKDWRQVEILCARHSALIPSFGLHPWHVHDKSPTWMSNLTDLILSDPAAVIGEIGLDRTIPVGNDSEQAEAFVAQLRLAKALVRPACVHCRKAWDIILPILEDVGGLPAGFILHSYSGSAELVPRLAAMGAYFSFSGAITWPRNERGRRAVVAVPPDRLLIETDSPDLMPAEATATGNSSPPSMKLNEPGNLVHVLNTVAALRNISVKALADRIWVNACHLLMPDRSKTVGLSTANDS
ncbi:MAG: TatD family hydrolase [bacterium]